MNIPGTGATTASKLCSTITASFKRTSSSSAVSATCQVCREKSELISTEYSFKTFSLAKTSFTAAGGSTTLSMLLQRKDTYTADSTSWYEITPSSGTLSVSVSNGSAGSISYARTSTSTITVNKNTSTSSTKTLTVTGSYSVGTGATATAKATIGKDSISSATDPNITTTGTLTAKGGNITISAPYTVTMVSGGSSTKYAKIEISEQENGDADGNPFSISGSGSSYTLTMSNMAKDYHYYCELYAYHSDSGSHESKKAINVYNYSTDSCTGTWSYNCGSRTRSCTITYDSGSTGTRSETQSYKSSKVDTDWTYE